MGFQFSTLFTAQDVGTLLNTDAGIDQAIQWCRATSVTRVYLESFRADYWVPREVLHHSKARFDQAGFETAGCVTTCGFGKRSTGWDIICCFTDAATQEQLQKVFEYTAEFFDLVMIDDFLFTDCTCEACKTARGDQPWSKYRSDLMVHLSRERILKPSRAVNSNVKLIIKYPQWYERFQERGYDTDRQTKDFDYIWVGTETRDPDNAEWGCKDQYEAYFIMRWLTDAGGNKTGGGWFDPYGTSPATYLEQARQTILGGAREAVLFCYGSLIQDNGPENVAALRQEIPGLMRLAELLDHRKIVGICAPKPLNSEAEEDAFIFDAVGMLGMPLVPATGFSSDVPCAVLTRHCIKQEGWDATLNTLLNAEKPLLITEGLAQLLKEQGMELGNSGASSVRILKTGGQPKSLYQMSEGALNEIRNHMLAPLGIELHGPAKVALYLLDNDMEVLENFNDMPVQMALRLSGRKPAHIRRILHTLPEKAAGVMLMHDGDACILQIPPRTLVVLN